MRLQDIRNNDNVIEIKLLNEEEIDFSTYIKLARKLARGRPLFIVFDLPFISITIYKNARTRYSRQRECKKK